jgi:hypothetical protein
MNYFSPKTEIAMAKMLADLPVACWEEKQAQS